MRYNFPFSFWDDGSEYVPADIYVEALRALIALLRHSEEVRDLAIEDYDSPSFLALIEAAKHCEMRAKGVPK